jgi:hypothetical protein
MKFFSALILATLLTNTALASECSLSIDRTACPGKEAEAKKPYDGKNPTEEKMPKAKDAEACLKAGEKSAKIVRKGTLSKKVVKVTFDGKMLGEKSDEQPCN